MNITIVSLWAQKLFRPDEPQPFGGAELQLVILARALVKIPGVTVRFITRGQGPAEIFLSDGIQIHKLPYRQSKLFRSVAGMWDCLRACADSQADIFIQRGGGYETGITGHTAKITKRPFLFMTSSTWDVDGTHENNRGFLYGKSYMYGLRHASEVITQTQHQNDLLLKRYNRCGTIMRSAHSIPETIPDTKQGILWVGRCEPCKNPELFLDLAEKIPEVSCTMVCPPANLSGMFENLQKRASTIKNLVFLPGVSFEETESLFASHKIMVNTSTQEGYPNTYVQAFKWGLPIVSAQFDPDNILHNNKMGLLAGDSPSKLTDEIHKLLNNESRWKEYSANARQFALDHHDVGKIALRLYELIESLRDPSS